MDIEFASRDLGIRKKLYFNEFLSNNCMLQSGKIVRGNLAFHHRRLRFVLTLHSTSNQLAVKYSVTILFCRYNLSGDLWRNFKLRNSQQKYYVLRDYNKSY